MHNSSSQNRLVRIAPFIYYNFVLSLVNVVFVFKFKSKENLRMILVAGSWNINPRIMRLSAS